MRELDQLQRELDDCIAEVVMVASAAATTTAMPWRAIVLAMTGRAGSVPTRAGAGANPAEVHSVLLAIHAAYDRRLAALEWATRQLPVADADADALWTFRHRRLATLVAVELAAYIKLVTPLVTVADAFACAIPRATAFAPAGPTSQLVRCVTCSAPRLRDGLYGNCLYCGHPIFTGRQEIR